MIIIPHMWVEYCTTVQGQVNLQPKELYTHVWHTCVRTKFNCIHTHRERETHTTHTAHDTWNCCPCCWLRLRHCGHCARELLWYDERVVEVGHRCHRPQRRRCRHRRLPPRRPDPMGLAPNRRGETRLKAATNGPQSPLETWPTRTSAIPPASADPKITTTTITTNVVIIAQTKIYFF
jgi:hypothetical protein